MNKRLNDLGPYSAQLDNWQAKALDSDGRAVGPKPTAEHFAIAHALTEQPGKQAFHIACTLRDCGQSVAGFEAAWAFGGGKTGPANNKRRATVRNGWATEQLLTSRPYTFKLTLTEKGKAYCAGQGLDFGKVKAARRPKPSKAPEQVIDTPAADTPVTTDTPVTDTVAPAPADTAS